MDIHTFYKFVVNFEKKKNSIEIREKKRRNNEKKYSLEINYYG